MYSIWFHLVPMACGQRLCRDLTSQQYTYNEDSGDRLLAMLLLQMQLAMAGLQ